MGRKQNNFLDDEEITSVGENDDTGLFDEEADSLFDPLEDDDEYLYEEEEEFREEEE